MLLIANETQVFSAASVHVTFSRAPKYFGLAKKNDFNF
jgi:hypothetical protein